MNMISLLFTIMVVFILSGGITTGLGYVVHWALHQSWSLWFYNAHQNHHMIQYPATDFFSSAYRSASKDSTIILFMVAFAPIVLGIVGLWFWGIISLSTCLVALSCLSFWGLMHNYFHDQFHLTGTFWNKFSFFTKWRHLHFLHHQKMHTNFGIIIFVWDKLFQSFLDKEL